MPKRSPWPRLARLRLRPAELAALAQAERRLSLTRAVAALRLALAAWRALAESRCMSAALVVRRVAAHRPVQPVPRPLSACPAQGAKTQDFATPHLAVRPQRKAA